MHQFLTFLILAIVVIISPGIDTALVTKATITASKKAGLLTALGVSTGVLVHTGAVSLGLSAILLKSAIAFEIVKYIGAGYLLFLGFQAFWSTRKSKKDNHIEADEAKQLKSANNIKSFYKQGFISNVFNPKVAVFFLTFLPQFVDPRSNAIEQFFLMGFIYAVLTIAWFLAFVHFINYLRHWLLTPKAKNIMERITGAVLIGFGLKLAFEKR